ncbi:MAG: hypothetical protein P4M14_00440 [Gammaproteobacteria bacterium]|nr:hypothetical protein [Gammaproteobacteria bacterium]
MRTSEITVEESKGYEDALESPRADLLKEFNDLQEIFECPVDLIPLTEDALFTPEGNCVGKSTLIAWVREHHTHPIHVTPLEEKDCVEREDFKILLRAFKAESAAIHTAILQMNKFNESLVLDQFHAFKVSAQIKSDAFDHIKESFNLKSIPNVIAQLRIDKNNIDHLKYWDSQNDRCFHGRGGVAITHEATGETFRIPTTVYEMMRVAAAKHKSSHAFNIAIEKARTHRASFFSNPFAFMTRKKETAELYNQAPDTNRMTIK